MTEDTVCRTLVRLYQTQARECGMTAPETGTPRPDEAADDDPGGARRARQLSADPADEAAYIMGLVNAACAQSGCSCADLLAAGYALRRWVQRRTLDEQRTWQRAHRCPHLTLIDGLAGAELAGAHGLRDWYVLAATFRRVTLRGDARGPVLHDCLIEWVEENPQHLA